MDFHDRLTLDRPRRDSAGNLVVSVLAARAGTQDYAGAEVGRPDLARVTVYRAPEEVFARESMRSFAAAPVTIDHPPASITPENWRDYAVGEVASDDIVKDGEAVRVPFLLRDAAAIATVEGGKREISMGYSCELVWGDGTAPDGTAYQARQTGIRINHLAIVDQARGGPALRIGDDGAVPADPVAPHRTITVDGQTLTVAEDVASVLTAQAATIACQATTIAARDGEIAALREAAPTPADIRAAARAWQMAVDGARLLAPRLAISDAMDEAAVKAAVVAARLGDQARGWTAAQIDISFATMLAEGTAGATDRPREALSGQPAIIGDGRGAAVAARAARLARFATAHIPAGPAPR